MTCGDCAHWGHCHWLISSLTGYEYECDWSPSRFVLRSDRPVARCTQPGGPCRDAECAGTATREPCGWWR